MNKRYAPADFDHRHFAFQRQSGLTRSDFGLRAPGYRLADTVVVGLSVAILASLALCWAFGWTGWLA